MMIFSYLLANFLLFQLDEPDIFLVENIADANSDALMLNTEIQLKYENLPYQKSSSLIMTLASIRCHTCRFHPQFREETMAQILQPCTLSLNFSHNEDFGTSIQFNMSHLYLNVSPRSIQIIVNSVQALIESLSVDKDLDLDKSISENDEDFRHLWTPK